MTNRIHDCKIIYNSKIKHFIIKSFYIKLGCLLKLLTNLINVYTIRACCKDLTLNKFGSDKLEFGGKMKWTSVNEIVENNM